MFTDKHEKIELKAQERIVVALNNEEGKPYAVIELRMGMDSRMGHGLEGRMIC